MTLILSDADMVQLLDMKRCVEACEEAYRELAYGRAATYVRRDIVLPTEQPDTVYRFVTMEGGILSMGVVAQRIDSEKVAWRRVDGILKQFEIPATLGGRYVGLVYLYSVQTGELLAIMNDGEISRMRVAGTSAVGVKYLARKDSKTLGLFGAGWHAGTQVPAIVAVREIERVKVYSPTTSRREAFCEEMSRKTGLDVIPVDQAIDAVKGVDIVQAATSSRQPVLKGEWIEKGMQLGCIVQPEFDEETWKRSDVLVASQLGKSEVKAVDDTARFTPHGMESPYEAARKRIRMLTELLRGEFRGRENDEQITLFFKGLGLGIEFAATAKVAYDEAVKRGVGKEIPTEWFTQATHT